MLGTGQHREGADPEGVQFVFQVEDGGLAESGLGGQVTTGHDPTQPDMGNGTK